MSEAGFTSRWNVSYLSRNYPQLWTSESADFTLLRDSIDQSAFGVKLLISVDHYHKATRSVKYAVLFIALTIIAFLLFEIVSRLRMHPFQYLLIGFAMSLFYLLLLSLSEHLPFSLSYLLAGAATVGLIVGYTVHLLEKKRRSALLALLLVLLYACLYVLLQLEDFALLFGSLLLLVILGLFMIRTRKVDWFALHLHGEGGPSGSKP